MSRGHQLDVSWEAFVGLSGHQRAHVALDSNDSVD
jgi:hypothetical protein